MESAQPLLEMDLMEIDEKITTGTYRSALKSVTNTSTTNTQEDSDLGQRALITQRTKRIISAWAIIGLDLFAQMEMTVQTSKLLYGPMHLSYRHNTKIMYYHSFGFLCLKHSELFSNSPCFLRRYITRSD